jgi:hypothetical protein
MGKGGNGKALALVGGGLMIGGLFLLGRKAGAAELPSVEPHEYGAPMQLTRNFDLAEFLVSKSFPAIKGYKLNRSELANVKALAEMLQWARDQPEIQAPIFITSGGRPLAMRADVQVKTPEGKIVVLKNATIDDALKASGHEPAKDSDHHRFAGADAKVMMQDRTGKWVIDRDKTRKLYEVLQRYPKARQVILYTLSGGGASHVHAAVVHPGHGKLTGERYAFVKLEPNAAA